MSMISPRSPISPRITPRLSGSISTPRRGNQQMVTVVQSEDNPLAAVSEVETIVIRVENLSDAKQISDSELERIISILSEIETSDRSNDELLWELDDLKTPYLFTSDGLLKLLDVTPSIKTKITMIAMIGPRLLDPKAKMTEMLSLFRYAEEKSKVEEILKARANTIASTTFKQAPLSLPGRGGRGGRGGTLGGRGSAQRITSMNRPQSERNLNALTSPQSTINTTTPTKESNGESFTTNKKVTYDVNETAESYTRMKSNSIEHRSKSMDDIDTIQDSTSMSMSMSIDDDNNVIKTSTSGEDIKGAGGEEENNDENGEGDGGGDDDIKDGVMKLLTRSRRAVTYAEKPKNSILALTRGVTRPPATGAQSRPLSFPDKSKSSNNLTATSNRSINNSHVNSFDHGHSQSMHSLPASRNNSRPVSRSGSNTSLFRLNIASLNSSPDSITKENNMKSKMSNLQNETVIGALDDMLEGLDIIRVSDDNKLISPMKDDMLHPMDNYNIILDNSSSQQQQQQQQQQQYSSSGMNRTDTGYYRSNTLSRDDDDGTQLQSRYAKDTSNDKPKVEIIGSSQGVQNIKQKFLNYSIQRERDTITSLNGVPNTTSPRTSMSYKSYYAPKFHLPPTKMTESGIVDAIIHVAEAVNMEPKMFLVMEPEEPLGEYLDPETGNNLKIYSYRELVRQNHFKQYRDVNIGALENHLSEDEFVEKFHMSKEQFHSQAKWRRNGQKKKLYLF